MLIAVHCLLWLASVWVLWMTCRSQRRNAITRPTSVSEEKIIW